MTVTLILKRGHGSVLNVVTYTPSSIGKFESNPRKRLRLRNSATPAAGYRGARGN